MVNCVHLYPSNQTKNRNHPFSLTRHRNKKKFHPINKRLTYKIGVDFFFHPSQIMDGLTYATGEVLASRKGDHELMIHSS